MSCFENHPITRKRYIENSKSLSDDDINSYIQFLCKKLDLFELENQLENVFNIFEEMEIFKENINLYEISIDFLIKLYENTDIIKSKHQVIGILIVCVLIINKYYIDDCYENIHISKKFGISLKRINYIEYKIFKKINHNLPFVSLTMKDVLDLRNRDITNIQPIEKKKTKMNKDYTVERICHAVKDGTIVVFNKKIKK